MTAKKKRPGGRVTPKGTPNPKKTAKHRSVELPKAVDHPAGHLPQQVQKEHGRGARPITHNRGNR